LLERTKPDQVQFRPSAPRLPLLYLFRLTNVETLQPPTSTTPGAWF
jgi:hypothetical protein